MTMDITLTNGLSGEVVLTCQGGVERGSVSDSLTDQQHIAVILISIARKLGIHVVTLFDEESSSSQANPYKISLYQGDLPVVTADEDGVNVLNDTLAKKHVTDIMNALNAMSRACSVYRRLKFGPASLARPMA